MKQMDPKNQGEFMASQQLKKMIPQLLLSVSLFSFVFSYSSFYSSSLAYSPKFHYYFSGISFQFLSHALNKNCLFLICNGLLVFLAKTSGFIEPPSSHDFNDELQQRISDSLQTALEKYVLEEVTHETTEEEREKSKSEIPEEVSIFIAESEEEGGGACDVEDDEEKEENQPDSRRCWLFNDDDQQLYGEEVEEEREEREEEDDDDDEEEGEEMSTEELNQKFEDFIRRMKEEIIISEARQKMVMVK